MFDSYYGSAGEIQLKNGPCILRVYRIGDSVEINDGIYHSNGDDMVIIQNGLLVNTLDAGTDVSMYNLPHYDKHGDDYTPTPISGPDTYVGNTQETRTDISVSPDIFVGQRNTYIIGDKVDIYDGIYHMPGYNGMTDPERNNPFPCIMIVENSTLVNVIQDPGLPNDSEFYDTWPSLYHYNQRNHEIAKSKIQRCIDELGSYKPWETSKDLEALFAFVKKHVPDLPEILFIEVGIVNTVYHPNTLPKYYGEKDGYTVMIQLDVFDKKTWNGWIRTNSLLLEVSRLSTPQEVANALEDKAENQFNTLRKFLNQ